MCLAQCDVRPKQQYTHALSHGWCLSLDPRQLPENHWNKSPQSLFPKATIALLLDCKVAVILYMIHSLERRAWFVLSSFWYTLLLGEIWYQCRLLHHVHTLYIVYHSCAMQLECMSCPDNPLHEYWSSIWAWPLIRGELWHLTWIHLIQTSNIQVWHQHRILHLSYNTFIFNLYLPQISYYYRWFRTNNI